MPCSGFWKAIILSALVSPHLFAAEPSLDELMGGFDDASTPSSTPSNNKPNDSFDELLGGFDEAPKGDTGTSDESEINDDINEKKWNINTLFSVSASYSYQQDKPQGDNADYRGLTKLRVKIQPEWQYKINAKWDTVISINTNYDLAYRIKGRSDFSQDTLDTNESELEIKEMFLRGTITPQLDIKIGRQIVVWGKSDSLRVVDILNPLDFREPGMVDIEDLRLPISMIKSDYYMGDWNLSAIIIPEIRFNKLPPFGSDFYLAGNNLLPPEDKPNHFSDSEFALAMMGNFSGWDVSLHYANVYNDMPHLSITNPKRREYARINMGGVAANIVSGSWLLKSELAYIDGLAFTSTQKKYSRMDAMVGTDYTGITDMTFSVEAVNRYVLAYDDFLNSSPDSTKENENQISLRYTATFLHQKLTSTILATFFGKSPDDGGFYRASLDYELDDAMSIIVGGIVYQSGDSLLLKSIASNDRVFADFRYSF